MECLVNTTEEHDRQELRATAWESLERKADLLEMFNEGGDGMISYKEWWEQPNATLYVE